MIRRGEVYYFETVLPDGTVIKSRFNYELYMQYYRARHKGEHPDRSIPNHSLIGKAFQRPDGDICIIEKVNKHWHFGYYENILYRMHNTKSHGTIVGKNISSICEAIIESANDFARCTILSPMEIPEEENV